MKNNEILKPARKNMVIYGALLLIGIILALTAASVVWGSIFFYKLSGGVFEGRGTRIELEPGDDILLEIGEALEIEFSKTMRGLDRLFAEELEPDGENYLFSGGVFEGRGTRIDLEPGDDILKEIGEALEIEFSKTIRGLDRFFVKVLVQDGR